MSHSGAHVTIIARNEKELQSAQKEIEVKHVLDYCSASLFIQQSCKNPTQRILSISADVTDDEQIAKVRVAEWCRFEQQSNRLRQAVNRAMDTNGVTDFVVLSAGAALPGLMLDTPSKVYRWVFGCCNFFVLDPAFIACRDQMTLNYLGSVYAVKACLPRMVQRGQGRLVATLNLVCLMFINCV